MVSSLKRESRNLTFCFKRYFNNLPAKKINQLSMPLINKDLYISIFSVTNNTSGIFTPWRKFLK